MFFRKRKRNGQVNAVTISEDGSIIEPEYYTVTFEMMMKGAEVQRRNRKVRQFAVMVGGTMRLVTSGDTVDRDTYHALVKAGAVAGPGTSIAAAGDASEKKAHSPEE